MIEALIIIICSTLSRVLSTWITEGRLRRKSDEEEDDAAPEEPEATGDEK